MTLLPAYGRTYKNAAAVRADWDAGKDFIISNRASPYDGLPANKEQLAGQSVGIRYPSASNPSKILFLS